MGGAQRIKRNFWGTTRWFLDDVHGATAVEFALVAFPMVGTALATMALGVIFLFSNSLDFAVEKAARSMMTGNIQSSQISAAQYKSTIFCPMLLSSFNCASVIINVIVERQATAAATTTGYSDLTNYNQTALLTTAYTNTGSAQFCTGQPGDYVYIQVLYPLPAIFSFLSPTGSVAQVNGQPAFLLDSTLAFRNEQFTPAATGC